MSKSENPGGGAEKAGRKSSVEKAAARLEASGRSTADEAAEAASAARDGATVDQAAVDTALAAGRDEPVPPKPEPPVGQPVAQPGRSGGRRVVELDLERMRSVGMVTSHEDRTQIAEEFRLVKRPLLLKAMEKGPGALRHGNLIMVASSSPNEGKTFCTVSLAMSIASERDLTVLLIDGDVAKPDIPNVMGFEAELGLMDLIADESLDVPDVLVRTNLDNLTILPAGRPHHLATELLASERMERLVADLANRYADRVIILDSPPVLTSSVASVLALHVGQILFVVEAEKTSKTAMDNALSLINTCNDISLLLNKARSVGGEKFGSYYYYYR